MKLTFGVPGVFAPSDAVQVSDATFSEALSEVPVFELELAVEPPTATDSLRISKWTGVQAAVLVESTTEEQDFHRLVAGTITRVQVLRNSEDLVKAIRVSMNAWPAAAGGTSFSTNYQFFENIDSVELASQLFTAAGGRLERHAALKPVLKRAYTVQYGESDDVYIRRILAQDHLIFAIRALWDQRGFPGAPVVLQMLVASSLEQLPPLSPALRNLVNLPVQSAVPGLRQGVFDLEDISNRRHGEIALVNAPAQCPTLDLRVAHDDPSAPHYWIDVQPDTSYTARADGETLAEKIGLAASANHSTFNCDLPYVCAGYQAFLTRSQPMRGQWIALVSTVQKYTRNQPGGWRALCTARSIHAASEWLPHPPPAPVIPGILRAIVLDGGAAPVYAQSHIEPDTVVHTDEHGRIRVRIMWHASTRRAETQDTRLWVRLMTPWAGHRAGMLALPRAGQEVVISFVNGDPDQPIALGTLYSEVDAGGSTPPWPLPEDSRYVGIGTRGKSTAEDQHVRLSADPLNPGVQIRSGRDAEVAAIRDVSIDAQRNIDAGAGAKASLHASNINIYTTSPVGAYAPAPQDQGSISLKASNSIHYFAPHVITQGEVSHTETTAYKHQMIGENDQIIGTAIRAIGCLVQGAVSVNQISQVKAEVTRVKLDYTSFKLDNTALKISNGLDLMRTVLGFNLEESNTKVTNAAESTEAGGPKTTMTAMNTFL